MAAAAGDEARIGVIELPVEVREALCGRPAVGQWEPMFALLTVDYAGYPHVCLLGRAEIDADDRRIVAVLASATADANLRRTGRATLIVFGADAATSCKLSTAGEPVDTAGLVAFTFTITSIKRDSVGVPLAAPKFFATHSLATSEQWTRAATILRRCR